MGAGLGIEPERDRGRRPAARDRARNTGCRRRHALQRSTDALKCASRPVRRVHRRAPARARSSSRRYRSGRGFRSSSGLRTRRNPIRTRSWSTIASANPAAAAVSRARCRRARAVRARSRVRRAAGASAAAAARPASVSSISVVLVWRPDALHSVSPWRTNHKSESIKQASRPRRGVRRGNRDGRSRPAPRPARGRSRPATRPRRTR